VADLAEEHPAVGELLSHPDGLADRTLAPMGADRDRLVAALHAVCDLLAREDLWHCLAFGTALGAVREGAVIEWDRDIDLFVRRADVERIVALTADGAVGGIELRRVRYPWIQLAVHDGVSTFDPGYLRILFDGEHVGELFAPSVFADGVLRYVDLASAVVWCPHWSLPHWFLEETTTVDLAGQPYPAPRAVEDYLAYVYGDDWRTPYRAVLDGGASRSGTTTHGDRYLPRLDRWIPWCEERGWDRSQYRLAPTWPRALRGAGPLGPDERTAASSGALWWRTLDELQASY
jgi:hypothetical protein